MRYSGVGGTQVAGKVPISKFPGISAVFEAMVAWFPEPLSEVGVVLPDPETERKILKSCFFLCQLLYSVPNLTFALYANQYLTNVLVHGSFQSIIS